MRINRCGFRTNLSSAFSLLLAAAAVLGSPLAVAQPVQTFLMEQGGVELTNSNLGQSAIAVQLTCLELIPLSGELTAAGDELFARCGELVHTADNFNRDGSSTLPRQLGYTDSEELLAAFQQVNGEEIQATANMSQNASNEQFSTIAARLGALRGVTSASLTSVTATGTDFMFGSGGGAAADDGSMPFGPWGWFFRGTYTTGERDPSDPTSFAGQENGFEFDQYGVTIGIDHSSGASVWGVALSYSSYALDMTNQSAGASIQTQVVEEGEIDADSISGTFFYDHSGQDGAYLSAVAGYGAQTFDMARNFIYFAPDPGVADIVDQTRSLIAAPDGDSLAASLTLGRAIYRGSFVIDPHLGVTYDRIIIDRYAEVDSGNTNSANPGAIQEGMQLAFDEQKINSKRTNVGIQFSSNINTGFGSVRPTLSADWFHEFENDPRVIKVKYALEETLANDASLPTNGFQTGFDGCVSCFSLTSEEPDSDFVVVGAGIAAATRGGFQSFLMFEALLGYEKLDAYSVTLGLRGQF